MGEPVPAVPPSRRVVAAAGVFAFAWALFWLFDQRMYDDDYGRWYVPAKELSYGAVLADFARPFPPDWGFLHRPALMLWFKAFGDLFGSAAGWYFAAKAAVFGGLVALLALGAGWLTGALSGSVRGANAAAGTAGLLFATSEPVFASLLWLSDMEVAAQCAVLAASALYLRPVVTERGGGWGAVALLVAVAFVGFKFKATAKLLPVLIGLHALTLDGAARRRGLAIGAGLLALCIPWTSPTLPPFVDFSGGGKTEWFYWQPANAGSWSWLLLGNPEPGPPTGLLETWAPAGLLLSAAGLVIVARAALPGRSGPAAMGARFAVLLLVLHVASLGTAPDIPPVLLGRYLLGVHLPLALLAGAAVGLAVARPRPKAAVVVAALLAGAQVVAGTLDTSVRKRTQGCQITVADRTSELVAETFRGANVVLLDLPDLAYGEPEPSNTMHSLTARARDVHVRLRTLGGGGRPLVVVSANPIPQGTGLRPHATVGTGAPGYWRLFGPPIGRCERTLYTSSGGARLR